MTLLVRRETDDSDAGRSALPRHRPVRRRRVVLLACAAGVLAAAAAGGAYAAAQSVSTYRAAQRGQANLVAFESALRSGQVPAAQRHLDAARSQLARADQQARPLRLWGRVPLLGRAGADAGHLLDSAHEVVDAGQQVLVLQGAVTGQSWVRDGKLRVDRLTALGPTARSLLIHAKAARRELRAVRGGWLSPGTAGVRDRAIGQVDQLLDTARRADMATTALPAAFGGQQWLVTTLNYAELHGGGGAPLSLATVTLADGGFRLTSRGQVSDFAQTHEMVPFNRVQNDPWQRFVYKQRFVNANLSPDFATDGEEMLRLYEGHFQDSAAGVLAIDPTAIAGVLRLTGPVETPGYGRLDAGNAVRKLVIDSYQTFGADAVSNVRRHQANDAMMDATVHKLLQLSPSNDQLHGLLQLARDGHLRVYSRDPRLQQLIRAVGLDGELTPFTGDQVGVYTFNLNSSKVDVWQRRSVQQDVTMSADGSARVLRTIKVTNAIQRDCPAIDPGQGYTTCLSAPYVTTAFPRQAQDVSMIVYDPRGTPPRGARVHHRVNEAGRQVWAAQIRLQPGETATVLLRYRLPAALLPDGYRLRWDGQPMASDPALTVRLTPAPGRPLTGPGWRADGKALVAARPLVGTGDLVASPQR